MADWLTASAGTLGGMLRRAVKPGLSWLVALALLGTALSVRLPGFDGRPLFVDELWRALLILDPRFLNNYLAPSVESAITSPVYVFLVKFFAAFWISPETLRLPSLLPGLLACLLAFALIRKSGGGILSAALAGLLFALNGSFIAYSNQMKPYMFEVCVHLGCMYAWLLTISMPRPSPRTWAICFFTLTLALLSTPTSVFLLPAFGITLFVRCWANADTKSLKLCSVGFAGLGVVVIALYYFSWRHGDSKEMLSIWADGFPSGNYVRFLGSHLLEMWQAAVQIIVVEPWLAALALVAIAASIGWAFFTTSPGRTTVRNCLLFYFILLITLCVLNAMRIWPLGALRPNLFLYGHMILFLFLLIAQVPFPRFALQFSVLCAVLALLLAAHSNAKKLNLRSLETRLYNYTAAVERSDLVVQDFSYGGPVGKAIMAACPKRKTTIIAEGAMGMAIQYYTKFDSAHRRDAALLDSQCVQLVNSADAYLDPQSEIAALSRTSSGTPEIWLLYTHLDADEVADLRRVTERFGKITQSKMYDGGAYAGYLKLLKSGGSAFPQ